MRLGFFGLDCGLIIIMEKLNSVGCAQRAGYTCALIMRKTLPDLIKCVLRRAMSIYTKFPALTFN